MKYNCTISRCDYQHDIAEEVLDHLKIRHMLILNENIKCISKNCSKILKSVKNLEIHVRSEHIDKKGEFKCGIYKCQIKEEINTIDQLYSHYYKHLKKENTTLKCFFKDCNRSLSQEPAFRQHLNYKHEKKEEYLSNLVFDFFVTENEINDFCETELCFETNNFLNHSLNNECDLMNAEKYYFELINYYMMLHLKLKDKFLIAKFKVDEIFECINNIISLNNNY
jgi:hypothetical protein